MKATKREKSPDPRMATTLERGLVILSAFQANDEGPLGNRDLSERTGLPKATISRLTYTLTKLGFLLHDRKHGFALGPAVLGPAYVFYARLDMRQLARPHMRRLATRPGVYLSLGTRYDLQIISLESVTADWHAPLTGLFNLRTPMAHSAVGHAYIAGAPEGERAALMKALRTRYGEDEWPSIRHHIDKGIEEVKQQGYCIVSDELQSMLSAVAAPIQAANLVLTLSAGGASRFLPSGELHKLGAQLVAVAALIQKAAGGPHPDENDDD